MKDGKKRVAAFCFLKHQDKYLLLKRTKIPYYGKYAPVGGSVEPHETPDQAAIRETKEEAGIHLNNLEFCGVLTETSPINYNWVSFVYTAEIQYQEPAECNEGILMWIDKKIAATLDIPPTDPIIYQFMAEGRTFVLNAMYDEDMQLISMKEELTNTIIV